MAYNKFKNKAGVILLDLTDDTVSSETLLEGVIAHDRSGVSIVGTRRLPTLFSPTISLVGKTLTVTPNAKNGSFETEHGLFEGDVLLCCFSGETIDLLSVSLEGGAHVLTVRAMGIGFADSEPSNSVVYVAEEVSFVASDGTVITDAEGVEIVLKEG